VDIARNRTATWLAESLRVFHGALENENSNRIQLRGMSLTAQTKRLERDGTAPGEGVENLRRLASVRFADQSPGYLQQVLILGVLPFAQVNNEAK
jgi:hypothetical protein